VLRGDVAQLLQEAGLGQDEARIGRIRLDDDAGDFVALFLKKLFQSRFVVEGQHAGQFGKGFRHAGAVGIAVRERSAASGDEEAVGMAVVAAVELHEAVAAGETTREADGGHRGLGAAADHAHFLNAGHPLADRAGHFDLVEIRDAEADAVLGGVVDRLDHRNRRMAENGRAPGADVVDHAAVIDIVDAAAFGALHEEGIAADVAEGAHGRVHAAGDVLLGEIEELGGKGSVGHGFWDGKGYAGVFGRRTKGCPGRLSRVFSARTATTMKALSFHGAAFGARLSLKRSTGQACPSRLEEQASAGAGHLSPWRA
jgi:hypothetical protein